jgi:hypothetical protein
MTTTSDLYTIVPVRFLDRLKLLFKPAQLRITVRFAVDGQIIKIDQIIATYERLKT